MSDSWCLRPARVQFENGVPVSTGYGDVYYSREGGIEETRTIFLKQNELPERWQAGAPASGTRSALFTIAEFGFGTGLNFCATAQAFRTHAPPHLRLHFLSCELHPLRRADLAQALDAYPELAAESRALLDAYPLPLSGVHTLPFDDRVQLTLLFGEAQAMYAGLAAPTAASGGVNAWYLDGFAPARNQDMWRPELFQEMRRLSAPEATFATYTAAGAVRRALQSAGFAVEKVAGFGAKREMLRGRLPTSAASPRNEHDVTRTPRPSGSGDAAIEVGDSTIETVDRAIVIGGGLAGTMTARALVHRGFQVTLIEREDRIAAQASGNALGVAAPAVTAASSHLARLSLAGFFYLLRSLPRLRQFADLTAVPGGVLLLAHTPALEKRFRAYLSLLSADQENHFVRHVPAGATAAVCGLACSSPGLFFPEGFCVPAPEVCRASLADAGRAEHSRDGTGLCTVLLRREALTLRRESNDWLVLDREQQPIARAPVLVLANARDAGLFPETGWLPLRRVRGQTFALPATARSVALKAAVIYDGYITPPLNGTHQVGASFEEWNENPETEPLQNQRLYEQLTRHVPPLLHETNAAERARQYLARVAFRTASTDRFPIIGPVPDRAAWIAAARSGKHAKQAGDFRANLPGLYVHTALGSRGLVFAPLGAEILAAQIAGEIPPVESDLLAALNAGRFLRRAWHRGELRE